MLPIAEGVRQGGPYLLVLALVIAACALPCLAFRTRLHRWLTDTSPEGNATDAVARLSIAIAAALVSLLAIIELVVVMGFVLGVSISAAHLAVALALATAVTVAAVNALGLVRRTTSTTAVLSVVGVLIAVSLSVSAHFYDLSWDGNTAHQTAVVRLAEGWNPVQDVSVGVDETRQWLAVEHYAKGAWIRSAVLYRATGHLEAGKAPTIILMAAAFFSWLSLLLSVVRGKRWVVGLGAAIAALNPISLAQWSTFLVDGQLASLFSICVAFGALLFTRRGRWPVLMAFGGALLMLSTMKFTGLVYAVELSLALGVGVFLWKSPAGRPLVLGSAATAVTLAVLFAGFNPYITNTSGHASPFYPLVGPGALDIISNNQPESFAGKGSLERLGLSLFSSAMALSPETPASTPVRLKVPFAVSRSEIRPYLDFQTHVAGFGPWFGGALVLTLGLVVGLLAAGDRESRAAAGPALFVAAVVVATTLSNPEAWWARYAPQLWLAPLGVAVAAVLFARPAALRVVGRMVLLAMLLDTAFVGVINASNAINGRTEIVEALRLGSGMSEKVLLRQLEFETSWVKLEEKGIEYELASDEATVAEGLTIPYTTATMFALP